jgi:hypothetical protein
MFKELSRGLSTFFSTQRVIILVIFFILIWGLWSYSGAKSLVVDSMDDGSNVNDHVKQPEVHMDAPAHDAPAGGYAMQQTIQPSELLPSDANSQWAALNPVNQGNIAMPDLLQAGYHIGLDTIGQTLRNPNYQLRSDPIIPKQEIGPWNQSTIEPDLGRVPLEVGVGGK